MSDFAFPFWLLARWSPVSAVDLTIPARWAWWFNRSMRCTPSVRPSLSWRHWRGSKKKKKDSRRCDVLGILSDTATGVGWCWWRLWSAEPMLAATVPYNGQVRSRTAAMRVVGLRTCGGETMSQPMGNGAHDSRQPSAKCQSRRAPLNVSNTFMHGSSSDSF